MQAQIPRREYRPLDYARVLRTCMYKMRGSNIPIQIQEDLAQDVCLNYLEGNGKHQRVAFALIDAMRGRFGDSRTQVVKPDSYMSHDEFTYNTIKGTTEISNFSLLLHKLSSYLKGRNFEIFTLYYLGDCTMKEIGTELGISEPRVSQIFKEIHIYLKQKI